MTTDYPDWTRLMQLIGADIMMPIDIQGAYIMMPVDIQAQYITLDIDITAQSVGNISIDIAAASVGNIGIDINAQSIGNITISIDAQNIGVQLQPDWQTLQGKQKYFRAFAVNQAYAEWATGNYEVPAGKTLYITHFGGSCYATAVADADKPQICRMQIWNSTDTEFLSERGGNGGGSMVLVTPAKIIAGKNFRYQIQNLANHNCTFYITAGGYEI